jgi:UDP-N-acetylglucosamine acyltransferase
VPILSFIHPTAIVEEGVQLGAQVSIGAWCHVHRGARLGDGCRLHDRVTIYGQVDLAPRVTVHANAVIGDLPQDLAFHPETTSHVVVGEDTVLREGMTIHRGTKPGSVTTVGRHCLLMGYSHVAHNATLGDHVIMVNNALVAGYAEIGDRAFLSGNTAVHQFCRMGRLSMISGCSGISLDLPPFFIVHTSASNQVAGLNVIGMRRAGISAEARMAVKKAFRLLYRDGLNTRQALEAMAPLRTVPEVNELACFIESSKRGICPYYGGGDDSDAD